MNRKIILIVNSGSRLDISDEKACIFPDHRNIIFHELYLKAKDYGYAMNMYSPSTKVKKNSILLFWNYRRSYPFLKSKNFEKYIILTEPPIVIPQNYNKNNYIDFKGIFTYYDKWIDNIKYHRSFYPNHFPRVYNFLPFRDRSKIVMIAGNKRNTHNMFNDIELYSQRVNFIEWAEKNIPSEFDLYGMGWDKKQLFGPFSRRLNKYNLLMKLIPPPKPYFSYKGSIESKSSILQKTLFSICFENAYNFEGYITEKIFDSIKSGCLPVYWGDKSITRHVGEKSFINYEMFSDVSTLHEFLGQISEKEYHESQKSMLEFLHSDRKKVFEASYIAENILKIISQ